MLNLKETTGAHHLTKLKELSLVQLRPEGNTHLDQLNSETLQQLSKVMFTPDQMAVLTHDIQSEEQKRSAPEHPPTTTMHQRSNSANFGAGGSDDVVKF